MTNSAGANPESTRLPPGPPAAPASADARFAKYGWHSTEASHTGNYLTEPIVAMCRAFGCRRVFDLGCGNGALAGRLAAEGFQVVGCDPDPDGIILARQAHPQVRFEVLGVYDDPASLAEQPFDAVISTEVVEHLFAPRALPRFAAKLLDRGGRLIVTTPYHGYLKNVLLSLAGKWDSHHSPLWDGGHIKFWSKATLSRLLTEEGFEVTDFRGAGRLPWLWKSMIIAARKL